MTTTIPERLFARLINPKDPTRDMKLLGFAAGVAASIVWLSLTLNREMNSGWTKAYGIFMGAVSLGGAAWTLVDRIKENKNENKPTTQQGTTNEGGKA